MCYRYTPYSPTTCPARDVYTMGGFTIEMKMGRIKAKSRDGKLTIHVAKRYADLSIMASDFCL